MGNLLSFLRSSNPRSRSHDLPEELVLQEILPWLPLKSLMRFKCVSKKWYNCIADEPFLSSAYLRRNPHMAEISNIVLVERRESGYKASKFTALLILGAQAKAVELQTDLSYFLPKLGLGDCDEIGILGTCDGLILLQRTLSIGREKPIILCNPVTREVRVLPGPIPMVQGRDFDGIVPCSILNLGFDDKRREHKVVRIIETWVRRRAFGDSIRFLNVQVISKSSKSWTRLKPISGYLLLDSRRTVSLDGALYFLASRGPAKAMRARVLCFDFRDDEVRDMVDVPGYNRSEEICNFKFDLILVKWKENSLGLMAFEDESREVFDFWVMNKDGRTAGGTFFWTKLFRTDLSQVKNADVCGVWRDKFLLQRWRSNEIELLLSDAVPGGEKQRRPKLAKIGTASAFSLAYDYVPSLVSVHPRQQPSLEAEREIHVPNEH